MSQSLLNAEQLATELFNHLKLSKSADFYLALSGGQDSCVLLNLMSQLTQSQTLNLTVLHFDHGLQAQSDQWAKHCEELADRYGVFFIAERQIVEVDPKKGLEASARAARYAWFTEVIKNRSANTCQHDAILLTAHHADDQAETLLINLMRGTGVNGLRGIARKREYDVYTLVRPLLDFSQRQISDYAEKNKLQWVDDPSNHEEKFRRNAIRKNVLPTLNSIKPDAIQQFVKSADHMVSTERLLADLAQLDLKTVQQNSYFPLDQSYGINLQDIKKLGDTVGVQRQANAISYWLQENGYSLNSRKNMQQLLDWSNHGAGERSELRNAGRVYRVYRNNLFVMPFTLLQHSQTTELVWQNLHKPLNVSSNRLTYEVHCLDVDKADQYSDIKILFADQARNFFSLKKPFQSAAIPHWRRNVTPILVSNNKIIGIVGSIKDTWLSIVE